MSITLNEVPQVGSTAKDLMRCDARANGMNKARKDSVLRPATDAEKIAVRRG